MKKVNELCDDELKQVTGGGSGWIPSGGIKYTDNYNYPQVGHYYSTGKTLGSSAYCYVTNIDGNLVFYNIENFWYDSSSWSSYGDGNTWKRLEDFMNDYRYELNITY